MGKKEFPERVCANCGEAFFPKVGNQRYCSRKCANAFYNRKAAAEIYNVNGTRESETCIECGEPLPPRRRQFCSKECCTIHHRKMRYGNPTKPTKIIERPQKPAEEPEKLPPWLEGTIMHETTAGWNSGWIPVKDDTAPQPAKAEIRPETLERIRRKT